MIDKQDKNVANAVLRNQRLQALLRYWNDKRGDRPMPTRTEIDPIEIPGLLPIAMIADVTRDGPRIRLLGSEATNAYGRETRGRMIDDLEFGEFTPLWRETFIRVARTGAPASAAGTFQAANRACGVEIVLLPLSDQNHPISHIFGGVVIRPLLNGVVQANGTPVFTPWLGNEADLECMELRTSSPPAR